MNKIGKPNVTRAPETGEGSATEEVVKRQVAKHALVNAQSEIVDDEESAFGIQYTQVASGDVFTYVPANGDALRMFAVFGMKTMATNEASQVRNNPKGAGSDAEQMEAIRERFALVDSGKWIDRTREGVGAKVDKDKLAQAIIEVLVADGKLTEAQAPDFLAKIRAKLEDDTGYQRTARNVPGVNEAYARLVGRQTKTTDDLMNI